MDERGEQLEELHGYAGKLLEEMRNPDLIDLLQETTTHLHDIAIEYSREADSWRDKYEESEKRNRDLQNTVDILTDQNTRLRNDLEDQTEKIRALDQDLSRNFQTKLDELREYRDREIFDYNQKVRSMIEAQQYLADEKSKYEQLNRDLENAKRESEEKRDEYDHLIRDNQSKLEDYDRLCEVERNAEQRINDTIQDANSKIQSANDERDSWKQKFFEEQGKREGLEQELANLKNQLQANSNHENGENMQPNSSETPVENQEDSSNSDESHSFRAQ
ncbi:MAG: hypothetical protein IJ575_05510 [Selenomonadaceae bacterium]|nr:hypothetical protein [Selenomonadaceae bacterium]